MKKCPFCAEDIQDAAIVCKHCGRDLAAPPTPAATTADTPRKKSHTVRNAVLILLLVLMGSCAVVYFGKDHQAFLAFDRERQEWHQRCDGYVNRSVKDIPTDRVAEFRQCEEDLKRLMRTAKERGWSQ